MNALEEMQEKFKIDYKKFIELNEEEGKSLKESNPAIWTEGTDIFMIQWYSDRIPIIESEMNQAIEPRKGELRKCWDFAHKVLKDFEEFKLTPGSRLKIPLGEKLISIPIPPESKPVREDARKSIELPYFYRSYALAIFYLEKMVNNFRFIEGNPGCNEFIERCNLESKSIEKIRKEYNKFKNQLYKPTSKKFGKGIHDMRKIFIQCGEILKEDPYIWDNPNILEMYKFEMDSFEEVHKD